MGECNMAKLKVKRMKGKAANQLKLGLFIKSTLVGFLLAAPVSSDTLLINDLSLEPDYQGLGYDHMLLEEVQQAATETGCSRMSLEIHPQQFSSYQHLGFVKDGEGFSRNGAELIRISRSIG
jgi:GNAT superfamily N-acetyltransferase